jgi:tetraacyldisaccharide 4'-kinase
VGNLAMGGRGKTPVVAHLARLLLEAGERPSILSRGYGRRRVEPGVVVVSEGAGPLTSVDRSGDEPMMLARTTTGVPVLVSEDRRLAGALAERVLGATVHLLDDGFQHLALARDVDLVLVKPGDLAGRAMPFGRLRESVGVLAVADAVIVDGPLSNADRLGSVTVFSLRRALGDVRDDNGDRWRPEDGPVVVLAGIAEPGHFLDMLTASGWTSASLITVRDHYRYGRGDVRRLVAAVDRTGARGVVTTAKDAARLTPLAPLPIAVAVAPLEVAIEPAAAFRGWLLERIREARG